MPVPRAVSVTINFSSNRFNPREWRRAVWLNYPKRNARVISPYQSLLLYYRDLSELAGLRALTIDISRVSRNDPRAHRSIMRHPAKHFKYFAFYLCFPFHFVQLGKVIFLPGFNVRLSALFQHADAGLRRCDTRRLPVNPLKARYAHNLFPGAHITRVIAVHWMHRAARPQPVNHGVARKNL